VNKYSFDRDQVEQIVGRRLTDAMVTQVDALIQDVPLNEKAAVFVGLRIGFEQGLYTGNAIRATGKDLPNPIPNPHRIETNIRGAQL
jgi:hypothetical protein